MLVSGLLSFPMELNQTWSCCEIPSLTPPCLPKFCDRCKRRTHFLFTMLWGVTVEGWLTRYHKIHMNSHISSPMPSTNQPCPKPTNSKMARKDSQEQFDEEARRDPQGNLYIKGFWRRQMRLCKKFSVNQYQSTIFYLN